MAHSQYISPHVRLNFGADKSPTHTNFDNVFKKRPDNMQDITIQRPSTMHVPSEDKVVQKEEAAIADVPVSDPATLRPCCEIVSGPVL